MPAKIIYITGVSGSGKSTIGRLLGETLGWQFADGDGFHPPGNIAKMAGGQPLDDSDRAAWLTAIHHFAQECLRRGDCAVIACSALKEKYRIILAADIPSHLLVWVHLAGDFDLIQKRLDNRPGHFMPPTLLPSQFETYEPPDYGLTLNVDQPPAILIEKIILHMKNNNTIGMIGMGVMGRSLARNLARKGAQVSLYNRYVPGHEEQVAQRTKETYPELAGALAFEDLELFLDSLPLPRKIWIMVDAGMAVDAVLNEMLPHLSEGDIVMDGGNSHFRDTNRREEFCEKHNIHFLGVGVSGGEAGALNGPAIMAGGRHDAFLEVQPLLAAIAAKDSNGQPCLGFFGHGGAGHFVKMVHNGIEYAEMQLLAEVYAALRWESCMEPDEIADLLDEHRQAGNDSYLIEITSKILRKRESEGWLLDFISDEAQHKGTGSWTVMAALELGVPVSIITAALYARFYASAKSDRTALHEIQGKHKSTVYGIEPKEVFHSFEFARLLNHREGFELIKAAAIHHDWDIALPELAQVWSNGCIIRSELLRKATKWLADQDDLMHHPDLVKTFSQKFNCLQHTLAELAHSDRAYPCLSAALNSYNSLTTAVSSGNLIQAQRDFFGAHTYHRTDDASGKKYHTEW